MKTLTQNPAGRVHDQNPESCYGMPDVGVHNMGEDVREYNDLHGNVKPVSLMSC